MKCPHCKGNISFFSKTLNSFSQKRLCPNCSNQVKLKINLKLLLLLAPLAFVFHLFILKPTIIALGFSGKNIVWISSTIALAFSLRLQSAEDKSPNKPRQRDTNT